LRDTWSPVCDCKTALIKQNKLETSFLLFEFGGFVLPTSAAVHARIPFVGNTDLSPINAFSVLLLPAPNKQTNNQS
jgi:hypothetical protein